MSPFGLPVSCPDCGGEVELVNARSTGTVSLAIVTCLPCGWEYEVLARIERHGPADTRVARQREHERVRRAASRAKVSA